MGNTIANRVYRDKYRLQVLDTALRGALVAEKICLVNRTENARIQSPFSSTPTVAVQALSGAYTIADYSTFDDTLTVTDEFIVAEHVRDFEESLTQFDLFTARTEQMSFNVAAQIDRYVLNNLLLDAGTLTNGNQSQAYTTPAGGFTTAANINTIFATLVSRVSGFVDAYMGNMFVVLENTDLVGLYAAGATNGFTFADNVLNNGKVGQWMGVDIYVVRTGTFVSSTIGTKTFVNANKRVFGVKNTSTLALPGNIKTEEKMVSGKTGMELATFGYLGHRVWSPKKPLIVDITLA